MTDDGRLTWRAVHAEAAHRLGVERKMEARWMMERTLGQSFATGLDESVADRHLAFFNEMLERRLAGEPIQYVLGRWAFRHLDLFIDRRVLIPRPETEVVAGLAIEAARGVVARSGAARVVDLGTGSGAIGLAMADEVPEAQIWATDVSEDALAVARANLIGLGSLAARRVTLLSGSWFHALPADLAGSVDVLVSNPPYVCDGDPDLAAGVLAWEPHVALFGGPEGLDALLHLIDGGRRWLRPGGTLVLELAPGQAAAAGDRALAAGYVATRLESDVAGHQRALVARR